jgi:hypothetical protein
MGRIAWIGGLDRNEQELTELAARCGHALEFHGGQVKGRGAAEIRSIVDRADAVVILTDVNSHGGVLVAKAQAKLRRVPMQLARRGGRARAQELLARAQAAIDAPRGERFRAAS